jgi:NADH:ubiquinone oxidoreductase subunit H
VLALILVSIAISGSSRIAEIVRMQGPWPNSWLAFHDPAFAALSVAAIGSLIPLSDGVVALDVTSPEPIRRSMSISVAALLAFITNRMHLWLQSILLALLLFGGWAVDQEPASPVLKHGIGIVLPTLALLAKAWAITALLTGARALFCDIRLRHTTRRMLRYGLPSVVVLAALSLSWVWCLRRWSVNWADVAMRWAILGVSVAWFLAVAVRVRNNPRGAEKAALENHWI